MIHNVRGVPGSFFAPDLKLQMAAAAMRRCCRRAGYRGRRNPMRQPQFMRSNTFHWAFQWSAGVFAVFIIVLFGFIYWKIE